MGGRHGSMCQTTHPERRIRLTTLASEYTNQSRALLSTTDWRATTAMMHVQRAKSCALSHAGRLLALRTQIQLPLVATYPGRHGLVLVGVLKHTNAHEPTRASVGDSHSIRQTMEKGGR